jgi:hypothetical protein
MVRGHVRQPSHESAHSQITTLLERDRQTLRHWEDRYNESLRLLAAPPDPLAAAVNALVDRHGVRAGPAGPPHRALPLLAADLHLDASPLHFKETLNSHHSLGTFIMDTVHGSRPPSAHGALIKLGDVRDVVIAARVHSGPALQSTRSHKEAMVRGRDVRWLWERWCVFVCVCVCVCVCVYAFECMRECAGAHVFACTHGRALCFASWLCAPLKSCGWGALELLPSGGGGARKG